jgi:ubiquitin-conjugating enzyme E2 R
MISVLSLLDDANSSSPANVDASVLLRDKPDAYKERVNKDVEQSKKDIPEGFVMPTHESVMAKRVQSTKEMDDDEFWADSGDDDEDLEDDEEGGWMGGSDSDAEMTMDDDGEEGDSGSEDEEEEKEKEKVEKE